MTNTKSPKTPIPLELINQKVSRLELGDIVKVPGKDSKSDKTTAEVIGIYPYIVKFSDMKTGTKFTLPIVDAAKAEIVLKKYEDRSEDEKIISDIVKDLNVEFTSEEK